MNIEDIRSKTDSELEFDLAKAKRSLFDLKIKASTQSIQSPAQIKQMRRGIAKINTVLHERTTGVRGQESR